MYKKNSCLYCSSCLYWRVVSIYIYFIYTYICICIYTLYMYTLYIYTLFTVFNEKTIKILIKRFQLLSLFTYVYIIYIWYVLDSKNSPKGFAIFGSSVFDRSLYWNVKLSNPPKEIPKNKFQPLNHVCTCQKSKNR